jgi:hypothetical protein
MKWTSFIVVAMLLMACNQKPKHPDVSAIQVNMQVIRFEDHFFEMDTNHLELGFEQLNKAYPGFSKDFLFNILGTTPDSAAKDAGQFIKSYRILYDSAKKLFANFQTIAEEVKKGLQHVKYYFPKYPLPTNLVSFIGPINSYGNIITSSALAVGLQMYMGKDYSLYATEMGQQMYPAYISRRFDKAYIPVNCMNNIIDDLYPNKSLGAPLVEQMIEAGKRQYLLDLFLPEMADSLKMGYTANQLAECNKNEAEIWSYFIQNNLLYITEPETTKEYMNDAPSTQALGTASPGKIGYFVGLKIVQKWVEKKGLITPDKLMQMPARQLFEESKYKPN